jgi:hypothetical protein
MVRLHHNNRGMEMHRKRIDDVSRVLEVLTRFPGLTQRALAEMHNIAPSLIYRCIEQKLIVAQEQVVGHRSGYHHVFRFYVNAQHAQKSRNAAE